MTRGALQCVLAVVAACMALAAAALCWYAATAPLSFKRTASSQAVSPGRTDRASATVFTAPPFDRLQSTASSPLFFEGRRYPTREVAKPIAAIAPIAPPQPPPPAAIGPDRLKLRGVRDFDGKPQVLIEMIQIPMNTRTTEVWLSIGEVFQGWKVEAINGNSVSLRHGGQSATLELYSATQSN